MKADDFAAAEAEAADWVATSDEPDARENRRRRRRGLEGKG